MGFLLFLSSCYYRKFSSFPIDRIALFSDIFWSLHFHLGQNISSLACYSFFISSRVGLLFPQFFSVRVRCWLILLLQIFSFLCCVLPWIPFSHCCNLLLCVSISVLSLLLLPFRFLGVGIVHSLFVSSYFHSLSS